MNKKICYIYTSPYPRKTGHTAADRRIRDFIRGSQETGMNPILISPNYHKKFTTNKNIEFETIYAGYNIFNSIKIMSRISFWIDCLKIILQKKIDIVFLYNTKIDSFFFSLIVKALRKKIIWEICDLHSYQGKNEKQHSLRMLSEKLNEKLMPMIADLVIVISKYLEQHIKKQYKKANIAIIPIMVDLELFKKGYSKRANESIKSKYKIEERDLIICYIGGFWHHQGVNFLIKAFAELININPKSKLILAGKLQKSKECDNIFYLVKKHQIENHCILTGWLKTEEVINLLYKSDIMVVPQINNEFTKAGMPTKIAEYCAASKAIIVTKVGEVENYLVDKESALLCSSENYKDILDKILLISSNPRLKYLLEKNAYSIAEKYFSYKKNGQVVLRAIEKIIK